jgi:DNA-binding response OmpR family regulator
MNHQSFSDKMQKYCIIYVEDDHEIRHYISSFLKHYCPNIFTCASAEKGLFLYKKYHPDILLLDINLGGMSGIELASKIREKDTKTRILISTAYTNKEFMIQAIELQLTRYLVKPMTNQDLVTALEKCWRELENKHNVPLGEDVVYNKHLATIKHGDITIPLRHKEIALLELFMDHEGELIRYEMIEHTIWKNEPMTRDAIRSQIRNLRKKLTIDVLKNVSGLGYKFVRKTNR